MWGPKAVYAAVGRIYGLRSHRPYRPVQILVVYTAGISNILMLFLDKTYTKSNKSVGKPF